MRSRDGGLRLKEVAEVSVELEDGYLGAPPRNLFTGLARGHGLLSLPQRSRFGSRRERAAGLLARWSLWIALVAFIVFPTMCFLALAVSPRLFAQGSAWFTWSNMEAAVSGSNLRAVVDSAWVGLATACGGVLVGLPLAWLAERSDLPGRRFLAGCMWLVLLLPSWLPATGWERLAQPDGILARIGLVPSWVSDLIMSPAGVVMVLALRSVPFSYFALSASLRGLGQEYEEAARTAGASWHRASRVLAAMLMPAIVSAFAISFAESVSDFGVAATLAYRSNFPLLTYQVFEAVDGFPPNFGEAAAAGWLLVSSVAIPLYLQARALRGRVYRVLSGRTRMVRRQPLGLAGKMAGGAFAVCYLAVALGVPGFGAVASSLLSDYGSSLTPTLANYEEVFAGSGAWGPIGRSMVYGAIGASVTVVVAVACASLLVGQERPARKVLDFLLLSSVALPGVVFGAGYIFAFNLPIWSWLGIDFYQTQMLLVVAYVASSLPSASRLLVGPVSQLDSSLASAGRIFGASPVQTWKRCLVPLLSRPILLCWLAVFAGVVLELPLSQLLYAPGDTPASVAIQDNLGNYHFGLGTAQAVVAVAAALGAVGAVMVVYRLAAPEGWRRLGRARG